MLRNVRETGAGICFKAQVCINSYFMMSWNEKSQIAVKTGQHLNSKMSEDNERYKKEKKKKRTKKYTTHGLLKENNMWIWNNKV